ncbi:50S ribosomal protein L25 [bacterium]|nr:50S ribosomal protein L25 [bacterium]
MAIYELHAERRDEKGKGAARRSRRAGRIPAVAYGGDITPTALSMDGDEFVKFTRKHNVSTALVRLSVDNGGELAGKVFIIRDLQVHHITRDPLSIDLLAIDLAKPIGVTVPVIYEGEAAGVKLGGVVTPIARDIEVSCLPTDIPNAIHCNVSALELGQTWYLSDLTLPEKVALASPADAPLIACVIPRAVEEKPAEEAGEGAEGEAEGEGKAKPAEGGGE